MLYTFTCGSHTFEKRVNRVVDYVKCECGSQARRKFDLSASIGGRHNGVFENGLPRSIRAALDEATGYKQEATKLIREAESNGFGYRK